MKTTRLLLGALALAATSSAGCVQTPGSVCQRMVDSIDAMYTRCGYSLRVVLTLNGAMTECGHVQRVDNQQQILNQCIPWADNVACNELVIDPGTGAPMLDPSCDFSLLSGVR